MSKYTNTFRVLQSEEEEECSKQVNMERKATKKLREIESLKKKNIKDLTDSEKEKIASEKVWRDILNPPPKEPPKESIKEQKKRLKKEKDIRRRKEEAERFKKEREEYEYLRKESEKQAKKEAEERRKREEEHERQNNPIEFEYKKRLQEYDGNTERAFRKCSLKFHPDKNIGNEKVANENQRKLLDIHEKYCKQIEKFGKK